MDWLRRPTVREVKAFTKHSNLLEIIDDLESYDWDDIGHWDTISENIGGSMDWSKVLENLHMNYDTLLETPVVIINWFSHAYDLGVVIYGEDK